RSSDLRGPRRRHFLRQRLCFGRVARALLAALRVIETELKLGGVPRTRQAIEYRCLPREVIRVRRRGVERVLEPRHLHDVVANGQAVEAWRAAAHIRECRNLFLWVRLL